MFHAIYTIECTQAIVLGRFRSKFPPSLNNRLHHFTRMRINQIWKTRTIIAIGNLKPLEPLQNCLVVFTRYSTRECDDDNLVTSFKSIRDQLVESGICIDDKRENMLTNYLFKKCKRGEEKITIEVQECQ